MEFNHVSVLLSEGVELLQIKPEGIYVDGTLGGGGHSAAIAQQLTTGRLIAFDQDQAAIEAAGKRLEGLQKNITLIHSNFKNLKQELQQRDIHHIDGMILDLGVSSAQLDIPERGFSYMQDAPLDMRMDQSSPFSAWHVVNEYSEKELKRIFWEYGEEKWSAQIARVIVDRRKQQPVESTLQLVDIIRGAVPKKFRDEHQHPAKRVFQAIRIEVNHELSILEDTIRDAFEMLNQGGVISVITFHSLEDRIIKNIFKELSTGCTCPSDFPVCVCGKTPEGKVMTRKPILPGDEELEHNPRARSAKLRGIQKLV